MTTPEASFADINNTKTLFIVDDFDFLSTSLFCQKNILRKQPGEPNFLWKQLQGFIALLARLLPKQSRNYQSRLKLLHASKENLMAYRTSIAGLDRQFFAVRKQKKSH